jgi:hypothetical protein
MSRGHYEQTHPNSCVPACMCMIQIWRGEPPTENAFHEGADRRGHDLGIVHRLSRVESLRAGAFDEDLAIHLALRQGRRIVVTVCGPRYVEWQRQHYESATSKHGELCAPGDHGPPFHALLVVARVEDDYEVFDPWFPADQQPFRMAEDSFQKCFAGHAVVALP